MDLRKVKKLIELVEESAIEELEVANGEESIRIVMRRGTAVAPVVATAPAAPVSAPPPAAGGAQINAPMAGTFYRAPHPDAAPFVEVGQTVSAGDVLCIIESMKMMHEIRSAESGVVSAVCVDNATAINTGDVLFVLS